MIDYTTASDVFAYGKVFNPTTEETAVMEDLVTAVSRYVDNQCSQKFSYATYEKQIFTPRIDVEGTLLFFFPSPTISSVTSIALRSGNVPLTTPINILGTGVEYDIIENNYGSKMMVYGYSMRAYRNSVLRAYVSWSGGWANLSEVPDEFQKMMWQLVWFNYKQREAPFDRTAVPEMGIITMPGSVAPNVLDTMLKFRWWYK